MELISLNRENNKSYLEKLDNRLLVYFMHNYNRKLSDRAESKNQNNEKQTVCFNIQFLRKSIYFELPQTNLEL